MSGSIPAELGSLSNLETLKLNGNDLSGAVPSELGDLTNLITLDLRGNNLTGPLPQSLIAMVDLASFMFDGNLDHATGGLCALDVPKFKSWLAGITTKDNSERPCPQVDTDKAALVALYHATDGPNWSNNTNWLTNKPFEEWYGVATTTDNSVSEVSLDNNGLNGALPTQLGGLINLVISEPQQQPVERFYTVRTWPAGRPDNSEPQRKRVERHYPT